MVVGLIPAKCINKDVDYNLRQLIKYLEIASKEQIDCIFFGEAFLQGFDSLNWSFENDKEVAVSKDAAIIDTIKHQAKHYGVGIGFGYFELSQASIYSSYLVISPQGKEVINYRRISTGWKDVSQTDHHYKEGKSIVQMNLAFYNFTLALCGDLWDEETIPLFLNNSVRNSRILWPVHVDYTKKAWLKEVPEYHKQATKFSDHVLLINNITEPLAHGGAFYFNKTAFESIDFDKEAILSIHLKETL